ncbi:MAG: hypothetical protein PHX08_26265 [Lachnospiraceae bacterium]|nr:hypothetical protein [Lachnospiraceae bacterium]
MADMSYGKRREKMLVLDKIAMLITLVFAIYAARDVYIHSKKKYLKYVFIITCLGVLMDMVERWRTVELMNTIYKGNVLLVLLFLGYAEKIFKTNKLYLILYFCGCGYFLVGYFIGNMTVGEKYYVYVNMIGYIISIICINIIRKVLCKKAEDFKK